MTERRQKQTGEVSLFVVIFVSMLITVVTIGFIRIMMQGQTESINSDVSRSAYDSAQAGVEDAKRAIVNYINNNCPSGCPVGTPDEATLSQSCNSAMDSRILPDLSGVRSGDEVKVQSTPNAQALKQAYTCVKVSLDSDDYIGRLNRDNSKLIALSGTSPFNTVEISWFTRSDAGSGTPSPLSVPTLSLRRPSQWDTFNGGIMPPIMRAQFIQYNPSGFKLSDFSSSVSSSSNSRTVFMYPEGPTGPVVSNSMILIDPRQSPTPSPNPGTLSNFRCNTTFPTGYECSVRLTINSSLLPARSRLAYLRLTSLYKDTSYMVRLIDSTVTPVKAVKFYRVQPVVDSTGRANDVFRRVQSRVEIGMEFPYPEAEIDTKGSLCKTFFVTDSTGDYNSGGCTPTSP